MHHLARMCALGIFALTAGSSDSLANPVSNEEILLELRQLKAENARLERRLNDLEHNRTDSQSTRSSSDSSVSALDQAVSQAKAEDIKQTDPSGPTLTTSAPSGGSQLKLLDISFDALVAGGWSSENDDEIGNLQGGGHDPNQRGFTVQNLELSLTGAVDPYLQGEAHIIYFIDSEGESNFELEEAFATTQTLPYGLQLEIGQSFTEFGLLNPTHPHTWDFLDQPIINSRVFGGDGMRGAGVRLGWLTPLPWFSELHVQLQNAKGETMASFRGEETVSGRPVFERETNGLDDLVVSSRWENSIDLSDTVVSKLGASAAFGPNSAGYDSSTKIYGADLKVKWRPSTNQRGWPFVTWQTEFIHRDYDAEAFSGDVTIEDGELERLELPDTTIRDWGLYSQLVWGFTPGWGAGFRVDYVTGNGEEREEDPSRDDRYRLSPLLFFQPSEFSKLRLQYNYDHADHLSDGDGNSVWLSFEWLYGAHPAHKY